MGRVPMNAREVLVGGYDMLQGGDGLGGVGLAMNLLHLKKRR